MLEENREVFAGMRITTAIVMGLLLTVVCSPAMAADQIVVEYFFERPEIIEVTIGGEIFHRVILVDAPNSGAIGHPALPARGAQILLPQGAEVAEIEVVPGKRVFLGRDYYIEPVARPFKLSSPPGSISPPTPDMTIYSSDRPFPEFEFEEVGTQAFRGYEILTLRLQPVRYVPGSGELYYYPDLTVIVHTAVAETSAPLFRGLAKDETHARAKVDNPEIADTYTAFARRLDSNYDLLILTTPGLAEAFQPLKDYHDTTGVPTEIHTVADVGSSNPDDVRAYITECYLNDGIGYLLIGADDDLIPAKDLYVRSWAGTGAYVEYNMPGDLYFGCLDGPYNFDGDIRWGEPEDGEGGGDVDLIAEVYVGRAAVGDTVEAGRFVSKTIQYLASSNPYKNNVLMCGEHLGFGGTGEYAAYAMDEIVNGTSAHGYTTYGIPSQWFIVDKLYDRDWQGKDWPREELSGRINADNGIHILNHLGHGNISYAMKFYSNDLISSLTNDNHFLAYSQACYSGCFDGADCWAEYANIKTDYGAFAAIMNARDGWGTSTTDGPSQRFNREFWDAVFSPLDYKPQLGRANQDSKEDNLYRINDACMRWCYYELTLFGDPTITIEYGGAHPDIAFEYPTGIPDTVRPYEEAPFEVVITRIFDGTPVPGSGRLHYTLNGGVEQTIPMTEISPDHYVAALPGISCADEMEFYISAEEATVGRKYDPDPGSPHSVIVTSAETVPFADDFFTDQGWTVSGDAAAGHWERGLPLGHGRRGDPMQDYDGSYRCYLTENVEGDSDVDDGTTYLISPTFDFSAFDGVIHYARWYSNDFETDPHNDVFVVSISNDNGQTWTTVETVGPADEASGGWYTHNFWPSDFVTLTAQMKVRFAASDLGDSSVVEAGVDDFRIIVYECEDCLCGGYCDLNLDQGINPIDVVYIVNYVYKDQDLRQELPICLGENGDWNCDGNVNPIDVVSYINHVYKGSGNGPCNPCSE